MEILLSLALSVSSVLLVFSLVFSFFFFVISLFLVFIRVVPFSEEDSGSWSLWRPRAHEKKRKRERDEEKKRVRWTGNYTRQSDCPLLNLIGRLIMRSLESIRSKTETDRPGELCRCVVVFHLRSAKPSMRMAEWRTGGRIAVYISYTALNSLWNRGVFQRSNSLLLLLPIKF